MAPPESTVATQPVSALPSGPVFLPYKKEGYYAGPKGTVLKGFGPAALNEFHYDVAATVDLPPVIPELEQTIKHTTQGVDVKPFTIVDGPQDWKAADWKGPENEAKWQYHLTATDISEIEAALDHVKTHNLGPDDLRAPSDFPLPTLGATLRAIRDEVVVGKGFHLIRGFPTHRFSRWQTVTAYYGLGLWWGKPQAQNAKGHMVGHIKAIGTDPHLEGVRPYTTSVPHGYHTDNSDTVALLCLHDAEEGGTTNWTSSVAVHNELLRRGRRDLVEVLTNAHYWLPAHNVWGSPNDSWAEGEGPRDEWVNSPVFTYHNNHLTVTYKEGAYYYQYKFPGSPKFTPLQEEALRTFTALAQSDELRLDLKLQPGDIGFINNITMLHAKTAFKDFTDPAKARHLLRLWVAAPNAPPLPAGSHYEATWGSVEVGDRGGYWLGHAYRRHIPLDPEYGDLEETRPKGL